MNKYLEPYITLMDFLADYLGKNTEIVLHDLTDWHASIVAIRNSHISGRSVGSPITDLALKIINEAKYKDHPYITGYQSRGKNGHVLKSATFFIRDKHDNIVGMMCLNSDCENLVRARDFLTDLIDNLEIPESCSDVSETFNLSVTDLIESNFEKVYPDVSIRPEELSQKEKMEIVEHLNDMGTFLMKGAVGHIADKLRVSIPTIYRYLNQIKGKSGQVHHTSDSFSADDELNH